MTYREQEFVFVEEIEDICDEREQLATDVVELSGDDPRRQRKAQRGKELDKHLDGLEWAQTAHDDEEVPQWDEDVDSVVLAGLTGGEFGAMKGEVAEAGNNGQPQQQVELVAKVRMGTVDAPYLDGSMTETQETAAVAGLPVGYLEWAADKIENLSSVGNGERTDFAILVAETQQNQ